MLRRLFLVFLPSLTTSVSYASEASWNCQQNKDTNEWVCVGEQKQIAKTPVVTPPVKPKPVEVVQPVLTESVEKVQPVKVQPVQVTQPSKPESAEGVQPVITKPVKEPPPVTVKTVESIQPPKPASAQVKQQVAAEPVKSVQPALTVSPPSKPVAESSELPVTAANGRGWNCGANKKDQSWNCQLVGAEPKGNVEVAATDEPKSKANVVATNEPMISLLTPAFSHRQEQVFGTLISQLKYDPWENCNAERGTQQGVASGPGADQRNTSPMDVKSNYAEVFDNEIRSFVGNVKMARADQQSSSKTANYDSVSEVLELHGDVYYREDTLALHSNTATLELASDQAKLRDAQFISPATSLRGRAQSVYRDSKTLSRYKEVAFTSCRPGNQDWVIHASELKMNKITGKGVANNAWMEFKGVPVMYSPYLSFPIDNRRLSGFLAPSFGNTKFGGFRMAAPYYWNIAPNYDATLIPRELSKRGPLLAAKFRYMTEQSKGNVGVEYMPHDSVLNATRYLASIKNTSQITPHISSNLDLNYVSDKTYFTELGNALSFANFNYLRSFANVNYAREGVSFSALADNYQLITTTIPDAALPYRRVPQLNLNLNHAFQFMPLNAAMENEYAFFQHDPVNIKDANNNATLDLNGQKINLTPSAQRINTKPSVSVPLQTPGSFFTPKLSLQHTQYALNYAQPGTSSSLSRTLPLFSADSGLFFERDLNIANTSYLHTLEPRLFYLFVPYTNQSYIPVLDSAQYDFQYNAMFRENSFSGTDRIQDANQVTTALTSRLVDEKAGLERLKLSVGEIFYFRDRNVTLIPNTIQTQGGLIQAQATSVQTNKFSNLVTELSSELSHQLSITTGLQWNPVLNDIERGKAALHYRNPANEIFNIGYLYRKNPQIPNHLNDITQSDMSFRYPIYDNWTAMGRWQYSLLYNKTQDAFMGLEKENCCWRFRIALRHYINNIANLNPGNVSSATNTVLSGTAQNGIFFEIELKGLSTIGDNMDYFLQQEIYGYRKSH